MNIPDNAVDAVARLNFEKAFPDKWAIQGDALKDHYRDVARQQIEAVAPYIAAQALRDESRRMKDHGTQEFYAHDRDTRNELQARAEKLDPS